MILFCFRILRTQPAIREAIVDSFLYENCSANINIQTEFCTGVPIVGGYGQIWTLENNEYKKIGYVHDVEVDNKN